MPRGRKSKPKFTIVPTENQKMEPVKDAGKTETVADVIEKEKQKKEAWP